MGKKIGQVNIDPESDKGFVQKEHWEKNFVCAQDFLTLIGTRLNLIATATATAKSLQSCPTLCDPIDGNPPGSPIPGILQARTLEWATYVLIIYVLMIQIYFFSQILQNYLETVKHSLYSKFYLLEVLIRY